MKKFSWFAVLLLIGVVILSGCASEQPQLYYHSSSVAAYQAALSRAQAGVPGASVEAFGRWVACGRPLSGPMAMRAALRRDARLNQPSLNNREVTAARFIFANQITMMAPHSTLADVNDTQLALDLAEPQLANVRDLIRIRNGAEIDHRYIRRTLDQERLRLTSPAAYAKFQREHDAWMAAQIERERVEEEQHLANIYNNNDSFSAGLQAGTNNAVSMINGAGRAYQQSVATRTAAAGSAQAYGNSNPSKYNGSFNPPRSSGSASRTNRGATAPGGNLPPCPGKNSCRSYCVNGASALNACSGAGCNCPYMNR